MNESESRITKKIYKIPIYYESGETKLMVYIADKLTDIKVYRDLVTGKLDDDDGTDAICIFDAPQDYNIRVMFERKYIEAGTIAHEAIHLKNQIFKNKGITNDPDNDEPEAYLVQWFVNKIHDVLAKDKEE